ELLVTSWVGWKVGLYSEAQRGEDGMVFALQNAVTVREERLIFEFWSTIGDGEFAIDPYPGHEADYPPFGYTGLMPHGYDYRYDTTPDSPN
ncbi:hypothetical protein Tco_0022510, partial [Tanacetum coccineum]